ncbi:TPA: ParB N-terminal domain-containing protein [Neisseria meningitidis]
MDNLQITYISVADLIPYAMNSRTHSESQIKQIAASIKEFGFCNPVLIDDDNGIIAGHGRVMAAEKLGMGTIPAVVLGNLTETQKKAYVIADNQLSLNAGWDLEILRLEVESLMEDDFNLDLLGFDDAFLDDLSGCLDDFNELGNGTPVRLTDRFLIPPFSVLNAREGWWVERKKKWLALGLKSEVGRDDLLCYSKSSQPPEIYEKKAKYEKKIGRKVTFDEFFEDNPDLKPLAGTSIFDPVLCEIVYRWFSPECGVVLDPFAGGSVRGVVASMLNRRYIGGDLRQEQVDENRKQGGEICADNQYPPAWVCGDSRNIHKTCADVEADLIFTCPPYADLEVYSDDPDDISTLGYSEFKQAYFQIIKNACTLLKNDRFA